MPSSFRTRWTLHCAVAASTGSLDTVSARSLSVVERDWECSFLRYVEKNNQGGLKWRKNTPKTVVQYSNLENPKRCLVRLLVYRQLCPTNCPDGVFYLQPLLKPTHTCWYSVKLIGCHTLKNMVKDMCRRAGIEGYKTNHSLFAPTARLFHAGIDEQLIMERTGHKSLDGVRSYKRTSEEQQAALSDIVNLSAPVTKKPNVMAASNQQMIGAAPGVSIQNCSNITININCGQR